MSERQREQPVAHHAPRSEPLSWNPILEIMETTSALRRLSEENSKVSKEMKEKDRLHQIEVATKAMGKIFHFKGEEKRIFFSLTPLDNPEKHLPDLEFTGFKNNDGQWYLGFNSEEGPLYVSVKQLEHSEQINHFRDETVIRN